jgi:hypothetical protein
MHLREGTSAMPSRFLSITSLLVVAASAGLANDKPKPGQAKKDGLSLTVCLDKKIYKPTDEVNLSFKLKNEGDRDIFIGDGFLAPGYHEAGPGRHFEVHISAEDRKALNFWSGLATEGDASGIRGVFKLKSGETYEGSILISAGAEKDKDGGRLRDKGTDKEHVLGKDGRKYGVGLRYQVNPKTHGVWKPPAEFKEELLWKGAMTSSPIQFEVVDK